MRPPRKRFKHPRKFKHDCRHETYNARRGIIGDRLKQGRHHKHIKHDTVVNGGTSLNNQPSSSTRSFEEMEEVSHLRPAPKELGRGLVQPRIDA